MWRVKEWNPLSRTGRIRGAHLQLEVTPEMIAVEELIVGEDVGVDLESTDPVPRARRVWPLKARQPTGSARQEFAELNAAELFDFEVESFTSGALTIIGGHDLAYSHDFEIVLHDIAWYSGAFYFHHALFRAASTEESAAIPPDARAEGTAFCIVTDHGNGADGPRFFAVASRAEVRRGTVYHYARSDLKPGERIADWVKKDA
jgi:hypothetical protein